MQLCDVVAVYGPAAISSLVSAMPQLAAKQALLRRYKSSLSRRIDVTACGRDLAPGISQSLEWCASNWGAQLSGSPGRAGPACPSGRIS